MNDPSDEPILNVLEETLQIVFEGCRAAMVDDRLRALAGRLRRAIDEESPAVTVTRLGPEGVETLRASDALIRGWVRWGPERPAGLPLYPAEGGPDVSFVVEAPDGELEAVLEGQPERILHRYREVTRRATPAELPAWAREPVAEPWDRSGNPSRLAR